MTLVNYFATGVDGEAVQTAVNTLGTEAFELTLSGIYSIAMLVLAFVSANFGLILSILALMFALGIVMNFAYKKFMSRKGKVRLGS